MSPNYAFIIELASRYLPPPGRLLDYGCGTAEAAALAIERGYDAYAVDTYLGVGDSPENLAVAIGATRLCYNASYLPSVAWLLLGRDFSANSSLKVPKKEARLWT